MMKLSRRAALFLSAALVLLLLAAGTAGAKLLPPAPEAVPVTGNNDDVPPPAALRKRNAEGPLHASRDDDNDRILNPSAPGAALHTAAPVPGNQSGPGMKATQYND